MLIYINEAEASVQKSAKEQKAPYSSCTRGGAVVRLCTKTVQLLSVNQQFLLQCQE